MSVSRLRFRWWVEVDKVSGSVQLQPNIMISFGLMETIMEVGSDHETASMLLVPNGSRIQ